MELAPLLIWGNKTMEADESRQYLATALVLEQIGRRADAAAWATGLHPAQWSALRYFARSGAEARTVAAFALSVGASLGTSWQTVKALISKGYVTRHKMPGRGKMLRIDLTSKGRQQITQDPLHAIAQAVARLDPSLRQALDEAGEILLRDLSPGNPEGDELPVPQQRSRPSIHPVPVEAAGSPVAEETAASEVVIGFYPRKSSAPSSSSL